MNSIIKRPIFWGGVALITFAYFTAKSDQSTQGVNNALTIIGIAGGAALIIYAVNNNRIPIPTV